MSSGHLKLLKLLWVAERTGKDAKIYAEYGKSFTLDTTTLNGHTVSVDKCASGLYKVTVVKVNTVFTFVSACVKSYVVFLKHRHIFVV